MDAGPRITPIHNTSSEPGSSERSLGKGIASEVTRLILLFTLCLLFGLASGYLLSSLFLGMLVYFIWTLWNLRNLHHWLIDRASGRQPQASGLWDDIFYLIAKLRREQQRERLQLLATIERVQRTAAALPDGVILLSNNDTIEWFNETARQMLGLRRPDTGSPLLNFIRHPEFVRYMHAGDFVEPIDMPSPNSNGARLQYQVTRFGKGETLVVVRDISRIFKLEQMRKDFVANVSHELRTPLTVIRGYVGTLAMSPDMPEKWAKAVDQMDGQCTRMTNLIQDLIELSKLETNESLPRHRSVPLTPMLEQIIADATLLSADKNHEFRYKCNEDIVLLGNEKELQSAFSNLVFNAVKYTPAESEITVTVRKHPQGLMVMIKDRGDGIDPVHLPRLTERFYRVDDSRATSTGGTGLGLAIVKHVLLRHGGRLNIRSRKGKGSTFTCIFPVQKIVEQVTE